jgi:hypothetical protein
MAPPRQDQASCRRSPFLCDLRERHHFVSRVIRQVRNRQHPSDRCLSSSIALFFAWLPSGVGRLRNEEVKSMDRLSRVIAGGCCTLFLGTLVSASGCRSMRNDVPPGKPYSTTGGSPAVGFGSDPRPNTGVGSGMYPNYGVTAGSASPSGNPATAGSSAPAQLGTPGLSASPYGTPTPGAYGAPGTNSGTSN